MRSLYDVPAPAKLNLFLHITGRRDDGYHLLQTVFQLLDHGDTVRLRRRDDGVIRLHSDIPGVASEQNLVVRAAKLLQAHSRSGAGADIELVKRLPMGGGIGGGSSDAATTLLGLNQLWNTGLDLDALARLGLALGADLPVFVRGRSAWAEGVGEHLQAVDLPDRWFIVLFPHCTVSTAEIFSDQALTRSTPAIKIAAFLDPVLGKDCRNDCEPVVMRRYPQVARALEWLDAYAPARMTGTGACVFASFADQRSAQRVLERLPPEWSGFIARGVNRSPAHIALEEIHEKIHKGALHPEQTK